MKDGLLDVYAFARSGQIARAEYGVFRSARFGTGPTDEEIERGDYSNFPWRRRRGLWKPGECVPLLWETKATHDGVVSVGLSNGSVEIRYLRRPGANSPPYLQGWDPETE